MNEKLLKCLLTSILEEKNIDGSVELKSEDVPFEIGKAYFIRTVTYHYTGRVTNIVGKFLILNDAAWIADSGRFMDALDSGKFDEIEPIKVSLRVNIDSIVDAIEWNHNLPREQK